MAFHEVRFPTGISRGSSGGPELKTEIVVMASGFEERNSLWAHSKRRYNAAYGIKTIDDVHAISHFFEGRRGRLHGFRWKDFTDYKTVAPLQPVTPLDQVIGTGDGANLTYQLSKTYVSGAQSYTRTIMKPVAGTVLVAVAGVQKTIVTHFNVDATTGIVTFTPGNAPGMGQQVTAGFEFDVPVRFDTDQLVWNLTDRLLGEIPEIPIVEVRL